nr:hypothetical protein Hi04_10k_c4003_00031 [uncultured bacterium]
MWPSYLIFGNFKVIHDALVAFLPNPFLLSQVEVQFLEKDAIESFILLVAVGTVWLELLDLDVSPWGGSPMRTIVVRLKISV